MKSWIWPLVDRGVNREATPAGRPAIPDLHPGEDRRAIRGGAQVTCTATRAPTLTRGLTPTHDLTRIDVRGASGAPAVCSAPC
jgi:hypothetical protein